MQYSFKIQAFKGKLSFLTLCKYEQEKYWKPRFPGFDFGSEHNSDDFSLLSQQVVGKKLSQTLLNCIV